MLFCISYIHIFVLNMALMCHSWECLKEFIKIKKFNLPLKSLYYFKFDGFWYIGFTLELQRSCQTATLVTSSSSRAFRRTLRFTKQSEVWVCTCVHRGCAISGTFGSYEKYAVEWICVIGNARASIDISKWFGRSTVWEDGLILHSWSPLQTQQVVCSHTIGIIHPNSMFNAGQLSEWSDSTSCPKHGAGGTRHAIPISSHLLCTFLTDFTSLLSSWALC